MHRSRPEISVVIGSYKRGSFLRRTIAAVRRELEGISAEIIVVDGGSGALTLAWLARQKDVVTILQHNRGLWRGKPVERRSWGYFMNLGFKCAQGSYVCMLSDDCLPVRGCLRRGMERIDSLRKDGSRVGAGAFYWRNAFAPGDWFVGLTYGGRVFVNHGLYLREALEDVAFCDEDRYFFYHGDTDLCLKMWERGWEVVDCPESFVEHFPHATRKVREGNQASQKRDMQAFTKRWESVFGEEGQPYDGGARYLEREDVHRTRRHFPLWAVASLYAERLVGRLRRIFHGGGA